MANFNNPNSKPNNSTLITEEKFYEMFPHMKPAGEPQFTKYDAFGIAANTDFGPYDSLYEEIFGK